MQKSLKKSLCVLLSILMIAGVFAIVPITASAVTANDISALSQQMDMLAYDRDEQGDYRAADALMSFSQGLYYAYNESEGNADDPKLERAYNIALAVYNHFNGTGSVNVTSVSSIEVEELKRALNALMADYMMSDDYNNAQVLHSAEEILEDASYAASGDDDPNLLSAYSLVSFILAQYTAPATYTVTWKNYDGTYIGTSEVAAGETPAFSNTIGTIKNKPEDDDYTYSFSGWTPELSAATGDATYTAVFNGEPKHQAGYYAVGTMTNWEIDDNYLLTKNDAAQGDEYMLTNVALTSTDAFKVVGYTAGQDWSWYPAGTGNDYAITSDGTYDIYFRPDYQGGNDWFYNCIYAAHTYTVTWKNWNGDVLETDENVAAGATPTYDGEAPAKAADAQNTYTFAAWDDGTTTYVLGVDDLPAVTADVTYTAVFTAETNTYKVTWKNWDGNVLKADENVPYGTVPEYKGARPEKPDVEDTAYTFTGWTPEVAAVTGDVEYTAEFGVHELIGDYYYVNGQRVGSYYGLIKYDGDFYYVDKYSKIIKNDEHWLVTTNGWTFADGTPIPKATYSFDADGKMIIPNGLVGDCYYIDGVKVGSYYGLVMDNGNYYYVDNNAKIVKNKTKFLNTTNGLTFADGTPIPKATYSFDADGKMIIPNGIDGDFYYINGVKVGSYYGLVKDGNDYYYVDANAKIVRSKNKYLTTTNDLTFPDGTPIPHKYFEFDADGKMIIPPEHAPAPAGISFTKVTHANQITEDNIGECTFAAAKTWALANWDDITNTDAGIDVVYFDGTALKSIFLAADLPKQDFEEMSSAGEDNPDIAEVEVWFNEYGDDVYICEKAS